MFSIHLPTELNFKVDTFSLARLHGVLVVDDNEEPLGCHE